MPLGVKKSRKIKRESMQKKLGTTERSIRVIGGLAIIAASIYAKSWLVLAGLVILGTGIIGWCGLYQLLGINTCKIKR